MNGEQAAFITCAMDAREEGVKAEDIREECACRLGMPVRPSENDTINPAEKE